MLGQPLAMELIERTLQTQRIAPAYLFSGPPGVGKAMAARHFAARLLGGDLGRIERRNHPDLWWVEPTYKKGDRLFTRAEARLDGALPRNLPQIRLEQVRAITLFLSRPALEAPRQVVIIDEAELLGEAAANALLKTLEEPGSAVFILLAPPTALLATVRSRCQRIPFYPVNAELMAEILQPHCSTPPAGRLLAMAQGSPGRALQLLQWFEAVPADLLAAIEPWTRAPLSLGAALALARQIDAELSLEAQLPLVDYLQQWAWEHGRIESCTALEALRRQLIAYASPRLAWEVAFLECATKT